MTKKELFNMAIKAKHLESLLEYINKRYQYSKKSKLEKLYTLIKEKYKDFFNNDKLNPLYIKLIYGYKLSSKLKNESVFINFCKIQTID